MGGTLQFSANISLGLGTGTRQGRGYYGTLIGSRMFSFDAVTFPMISTDLETSFQHPESYRKMLHISPNEPFRNIDSFLIFPPNFVKIG